MKFQNGELHYIQNLIFSFRGVQVMLDRDLAELYQVETKVLNQAVKRNIERFPDSFRFQLSNSEFEHWRSQIVTSNADRMGLRRAPFAFTEQGIAMLSAVLRSSVAIQTSIQIMNAFVEMRKFFLVNREMFQRLETVEKKLLVNDFHFEKIFKAIESNQLVPNQGIFFEGQVFDAQFIVSKIIKSATSSIVVIDNYMDDTVLSVLSKKALGVKVWLLTKQISKQFENDVSKANSQFGDFYLKPFTFSHDRFLIIDRNQIYHLGASIKDLGKKWFAFTKLNSESVKILEKISPFIED